MAKKNSTANISIFLLLALFVLHFFYPPWPYLHRQILRDADTTANPVVKALIHFFQPDPSKLGQAQYEEDVRGRPDDYIIPAPGKRSIITGAVARPGKTVLADWQVKIGGAIPEGVRYSIRVIYQAQKENRFCQNGFGIKNPWTSHAEQRTKVFSYEPYIENGRHNLTIPLNELRPDRGCRYFPFYIKFSLRAANGDRYDEFLFAGKYMMEPGRFRKAGNGVIDMTCYRAGKHSNHCSQGIITPRHYENTNITQRLHRDNRDYTVNINILPEAEQEELQKQRVPLERGG